VHEVYDQIKCLSLLPAVDVSAAMVKDAPDFCAVCVIFKGKVVTVRCSAKGSVPANSSPQKKNIDPDDSVK